MTSQDRLNAVIAYFFLWPVFLLAKRDTPLWHPFVQEHAKKSSIILLVFSIIFVVFHFILAPYIQFSFFGFSLRAILQALIVSLLCLILATKAYKAFHDEAAIHHENHQENDKNERILYSNETDRIRLLWGFIPLISLWVSSRYDSQDTEIWRKVSSCIFIVFSLCIIFTGSTSALSLLVLFLSIAYIVFIGINLLFSGVFVRYSFYSYIPTYRDILDILSAIFKTIWENIRVIFWKEKEYSFKSILFSLKEQKREKFTINDSPIPLWLIGIPLINLIFLPILFQRKYKELRGLIIQWMALSFFFSLTLWIYSLSTPILLLFLIPSIHLMAYSLIDVYTKVPFFSIFSSLWNIFTSSHETISELKNTKEEIRFQYEKE